MGDWFGNEQSTVLYTPVADLDGRTALHEACKEGHTACALRLVDAGAETDIKDAWGLTPRALAQQKGHKSLAKMLPD